jgi:hypothetical protein
MLPGGNRLSERMDGFAFPLILRAQRSLRSVRLESDAAMEAR